jgi:hypothetical protein
VSSHAEAVAVVRGSAPPFMPQKHHQHPDSLMFDGPRVQLHGEQIVRWELVPRLGWEALCLLDTCPSDAPWQAWWTLYVMVGHAENGTVVLTSYDEFSALPLQEAKALIATALRYGIVDSPAPLQVEWFSGGARVTLSYEVDGIRQFVLNPLPCELSLVHRSLHPSRTLFNLMSCSSEGCVMHGMTLADCLFMLNEVAPRLSTPRVLH